MAIHRSGNAAKIKGWRGEDYARGQDDPPDRRGNRCLETGRSSAYKARTTVNKITSVYVNG